jgi:acyl carrier protein
MDAQTVTETIRRFLSESFMIDFDRVAADADLFEAKYLDSFGFVDLVTFLEQTFAIKLSEADLAEPAMGSLAGMSSLVLRCIGKRGTAA